MKVLKFASKDLGNAWRTLFLRNLKSDFCEVLCAKVTTGFLNYEPKRIIIPGRPVFNITKRKMNCVRDR